MNINSCQLRGAQITFCCSNDWHVGHRFDVLHLFEARNEVHAIAIASTNSNTSTQQYFDGIHLFGAKGEVESLLNEASKIQVRLKSLLHEYSHSHFQYYLK